MKISRYLFYLICVFFIISIICTIFSPTPYNFSCNIICLCCCISCYFSMKSTIRSYNYINQYKNLFCDGYHIGKNREYNTDYEN